MMSGQAPLGAQGGGGSGMLGAGGAGQQSPLFAFLGGMFGKSGDPYKDYMKQYQDWVNKAQNVQNPFVNAGTGAIGDYQKWLSGMQDPSKFINNMMGQYQESPWAKYQQNQAMHAGQNAASAGGLIGSTPYMQQAQQSAHDISGQDMGNWMQNVLGINNQYGQGQNNLINYGSNAANALTNLYGQSARDMGEAAYGKRLGKNQDFWNMINGGINMFTNGILSNGGMGGGGGGMNIASLFG